MTDMQMMDDENSVLPKPNEVDLFNDWKLLGDYDLNNVFIPVFLSCMTLFFGIGVVFGWYADKMMARNIEALEERMYLLGGDITIDAHETAEDKTRTWKQKCWSYWKCWKCNKV